MSVDIIRDESSRRGNLRGRNAYYRKRNYLRRVIVYSIIS